MAVMHDCDVDVVWRWSWVVILQRWAIAVLVVVLKCVGAVGVLLVRAMYGKRNKQRRTTEE